MFIVVISSWLFEKKEKIAKCYWIWEEYRVRWRCMHWSWIAVVFIQITIGTFCRSKCLFHKILQRNDSYALRTQTWNANYTVWRTAMFSRFFRWITTTINLFPQESSVYPRSKLLYLCPTASHLLVGLAAHTLWAKTHLSIKNTCERFHLNGRHKHPVWCRKYIVKLYPRFDNSTTFERLAFLKIPLFSFQLFLQGSFKSKILIVKTEYVNFFSGRLIMQEVVAPTTCIIIND